MLELGFTADEIDGIRKTFQNDPDDCYREGLSEWLKGGERSLKDLMEALSSPTVGHSDIAESLAAPAAPSGKQP